MSELASRPPADRCPGVLRPYVSGDGALVRLRAPGGRMRAPTLTALAWYASEHGAPLLQLTSRGNLQVRGLPEPLPSDLEPFVTHLGLLPSSTHEVMRNLIAAPSNVDLAVDYDQRLRAEPALARLPGRWLVAFDDDAGRLLGEPWDLSYQALTDDRGVIRAAAHTRGRVVAREQAVDTLIELSLGAVSDLAEAREGVWNVRELAPDARVFRNLTEPVSPVATGVPPMPGHTADGLLVGVPLGLLTLAQAEAIGEVCDSVQITVWRSILLMDSPPDEVLITKLRATGLVTDAGDAFSRVTACVGAPHCARTASPTLTIARTLATAHLDRQVHVSGCVRRCGQPPRAADLIAPADVTEARSMLADMEDQ